MLRSTVRRPVYLGIKHPSGAYDQIIITVWQLRVCWFGALSPTKRTGLSCTIAAGLRQRSHSRVRVPWISGPYLTVSVKVKVTLQLTVSQSVSLGVEPHLGLMTRLLPFYSYGLVFVGRLLWQEDGSVFRICCWTLPAQSFSDPSPLGLATIFHCLSWVEFHVTTDGQPASLFWNKAPIWGLSPDLCYCQTVGGLLMRGALSDERTGLSFGRVIAVISLLSVCTVYVLRVIKCMYILLQHIQGLCQSRLSTGFCCC
jgi:hypothetical protein